MGPFAPNVLKPRTECSASSVVFCFSSQGAVLGARESLPVAVGFGDTSLRQELVVSRCWAVVTRKKSVAKNWALVLGQGLLVQNERMETLSGKRRAEGPPGEGLQVSEAAGAAAISRGNLPFRTALKFSKCSLKLERVFPMTVSRMPFPLEALS